MVTPDKDYGQLIRPNVYIYKQRKGGNEGVEIIGCEQVCEHYGIDDPKQVIDILALWGDASDNIPGVPGIGEKSAVKLICQYGTVENLLDNTEKLSGKQRENIERLREQILLAKRLATIEQHVPVAFEPEKNGHGIAGRRPSGRGFPGTGFSLAAAGNAARTSRRRHSDGRQTRAAQIRRFAFRTPDDRGSNLFSALEQTAGGSSGQADLFGASTYETIDTVAHTYHIVETQQALEALRDRLAAVREFCFDTETTGFDVFGDRLVGISVAVEPHEAWYIRATRKTRKESSTRYARFSKTSESLKSGRTSNSTL